MRMKKIRRTIVLLLVVTLLSSNTVLAADWVDTVNGEQEASEINDVEKSENNEEAVDASEENVSTKEEAKEAIKRKEYILDLESGSPIAIDKDELENDIDRSRLLLPDTVDPDGWSFDAATGTLTCDKECADRSWRKAYNPDDVKRIVFTNNVKSIAEVDGPYGEGGFLLV